MKYVAAIMVERINGMIIEYVYDVIIESGSDIIVGSVSEAVEHEGSTDIAKRVCAES